MPRRHVSAFRAAANQGAAAIIDALERRQLLTVTLSVPDPNVREGGNNGQYEITRDDSFPVSDLIVNFTVAGTAVRGRDYVLKVDGHKITGSTVVIPALSSSVDVDFVVEDDALVEPEEFATFTLQPSADYTLGSAITATVSVLDNDRTPAAVDASADGSDVSNLPSTDFTLSDNGNYATFVSNATNLVNSPLTTYQQVYRRNLISGTTDLVSFDSGGKTEANNDAVRAVVSADGRYVAFETTATDIVPGNVDQNFVSDVYWRDMVTKQTTLVSKGGTPALGGSLVAISSDGQRILFTSTTAASSFVKGVTDTNNTDDLFVWSHRTGKAECVSVTPNGNATGNRSSVGSNLVGEASFSLDGNLVLFPSRASDLVTGVNDGNTFQYDLFVRDLSAKTTDFISVSSDPTSGANGISGYGKMTSDGNLVVFRSNASNLNGVDVNDTYDIFVRNRSAGTTTLLSTTTAGGISATGTPGVPHITSDGRFVVFSTTADDMLALDHNGFSDVYRINVATLEKTLVSVDSAGTNGGGADSLEAQITNDGNIVVFTTFAPDLAGDFDKTDANFSAVYARNLTTGVNTALSVNRSGNAAGADASGILISDDGTRTGFYSADSTILTTDDFNHTDFFVVDTPSHEGVSIDSAGNVTVFGSILADQVNIQRVNSTYIIRRNNLRYEYNIADVNAFNILTGDGDDSVVIGPSVELGVYISAGSGNDHIQGGGGPDKVQGGPGRDLINGGEGNDRLDGGKGNDTVNGEGGKDRVIGGDGADVVNGGGGADRIFDGIGNDTYNGGTGDDRFYTAADGSPDLFFGNDGNDTLIRVGLTTDPDDVFDSIEVTA